MGGGSSGWSGWRERLKKNVARREAAWRPRRSAEDRLSCHPSGESGGRRRGGRGNSGGRYHPRHPVTGRRGLKIDGTLNRGCGVGEGVSGRGEGNTQMGIGWDGIGWEAAGGLGGRDDRSVYQGLGLGGTRRNPGGRGRRLLRSGSLAPSPLRLGRGRLMPAGLPE